MLRHIADHSQQPLCKYSLDDLLALQQLSPEERLQHLDRVLHVGISKIVLLLQDMPLGFGTRRAIRNVTMDYVQDLVELKRCPPETDPNQFKACIFDIFARHRGMLGQISDGLREFQQDVRKEFEPAGDLRHATLSDAADLVPPVLKIERSLDEFFTIRTTLRLLISHCLQLSPDDRHLRHGFAMHELLQQMPSRRRQDQEKGSAGHLRHVGAICMDTRPCHIMVEAYRHAQFVCQRRLSRPGGAPELMVNCVPADTFLADQRLADSQAGAAGLDSQFPYVDIHLYFVFYEVLKNAILTSMRKAGQGGVAPAVHASLISGTSLTDENERTVKITDTGEGIGREEMRKIWSYFHSTRHQGREGFAPIGSDGTPDEPHDPTRTSRGLGLSVSRVLVRYFGGEIDVHSIPRKGTDVYIYL